jgi:hypothetical protein
VNRDSSLCGGTTASGAIGFRNGFRVLVERFLSRQMHSSFRHHNAPKPYNHAGLRGELLLAQRALDSNAEAGGELEAAPGLRPAAFRNSAVLRVAISLVTRAAVVHHGLRNAGG